MQKFREEVRAFLDVALTPDLRAAGRATTGFYSDPAAGALWHQRLYDKGWIAASWPKAWGGTGWSPVERAIFDEECARNDAPIFFSTGLRSIGPLIIEMGSQAQRDAYIERILRGQDCWCQGFSEPGAGSDLSGIVASARRDGDTFILNGQKIWTTGAHISNRMFAIFRSDPQSRGNAGMSFFLLDMATPGIRVQPLIDLRGEHEFNQVFFDDVVIPASCLVGEQDDGWRVARRLMALARSNNSPSSHTRRVLNRIRDALPSDAPGEHIARLAELEVALDAFWAFEQRQLAAASSTGATGSSTLKLLGSELKQKACELAYDIGAANIDDPEQLTFVTKRYLYSRSASIYSGTSEVHHNILARELLKGAV